MHSRSATPVAMSPLPYPYKAANLAIYLPLSTSPLLMSLAVTILSTVHKPSSHLYRQLLALWAKMGCALGNHYPLNRGSATLAYLHGIGFMVDMQMIIIVTSLSLQVAIATERRAAMLNASCQHQHDNC